MTDGGFGPGIGAFAVFFILAICLWLLMRNMNARLRRMSYAERRAEQAGAGRPGQVPGSGQPHAPGAAGESGGAGDSGAAGDAVQRD